LEAAVMTRPYSMDLRERAVARVLAGESVRSVASVAASLFAGDQALRRNRLFADAN
jgi:transposase-like protein